MSIESLCSQACRPNSGTELWAYLLIYPSRLNSHNLLSGLRHQIDLDSDRYITTHLFEIVFA